MDSPVIKRDGFQSIKNATDEIHGHVIDWKEIFATTKTDQKSIYTK